MIKPILDHWDSWMESSPETLTFWTTQFLSNHGCFRVYVRVYLHKIKATALTKCVEYYHTYDLVRHTLARYPIFGTQRMSPQSVIGNDLSVNSLIGALLDSGQKRVAVTKFCKEVLQLKENKEREFENIDRRKARKIRRLAKRCTSRRSWL